VACANQQCTGDALYTFTSDTTDQCVDFLPSAMAFSAMPLWNADY
jgi:hypothetical protein